MTPAGADLARRTYAAALKDGPSQMPKAVASELGAIAARHAQPQGAELDVEGLSHAVDEEFSFLRPVVSAGRSLQDVQQTAWEAAVRAILRALSAWKGELPHEQDQLRALLVGLSVLDVRSAGLESVATSLASPTLKAALVQMLAGVQVEPASMAMRMYPDLQRELSSAAQQGNYERLEHYLRNLLPEPQLDLFAALALLWHMDQAAVLKAIADRNDVLFSMSVLLVLGDQLATLALQAPNDAFRFVSVDFLQHAANSETPGANWEDVMQQVLVAAAADSHWDGWTQALFKYFDQRSLPGRVLGRVLANLDEGRWEAVIKAFALGYTGRMAEPVAHVLIEFSQLAHADKTAAFWKLAFQHWDALDYRSEEKKSHMFSPVATSLDFPVSMYYSQRPAAELDVEQARLSGELKEVEQKRYESASDLVTERNRILSRLRLLKHGRAIANKAANGLPEPVAPEPDRYSQIKYHYHDHAASLWG